MDQIKATTQALTDEFDTAGGVDTLVDHVPKVFDAILGLIKNFADQKVAEVLNGNWVESYKAMFDIFGEEPGPIIDLNTRTDG